MIGDTHPEVDMSNPFDAPDAITTPPTGGGDGSLDAVDAIRRGWDALTTHGLVLMAALIVGGLAAGLSALLCFLPVLLVGPVIYWGLLRMSLDALDGIPQFETLFAGFSRLGDVWLPMFLVMLLNFIAALPGSIAGQVLSFAVGAMGDEGGLFGTLLLSLASMLVQLGWSIVVVSRFLLAPAFVVDRGMDAVGAMSDSWQRTSGNNWFQVMLLVVLQTVIGLIGMLMCFVGAFPAAVITTVASVAAARQALGES